METQEIMLLIAGAYAALAALVKLYRSKEADLKIFVMMTEWRGDNWLLKQIGKVVRALGWLLELLAPLVPVLGRQKKEAKEADKLYK